MGFTYRVASAPPPAEEALPTEAERRRIFATKAGGWDREVFFQEILMGIGRWRKELIQQAKGDVLEVAAGTGRNFRYYDNARVRSLTVTDFCSPMVEEARTKKGELGTIPHSFRLANACKLPDPAEKYHAVVETFALCSYEDPVKTLKELRRVLQPEGSLLLLEHGASSWPLVNLILSRGCAHHVKQFGCYPNRPVVDLVKQAGFEVVSAKRKNFGTTYLIVAKKGREETDEKSEGNTKSDG
ncbi:methyltransferase OMS1, mitochondrial-like [Cyclospora cayetanensis]|uniref:Methyltransferase OMS1, mitochondrial-like n=1 Tax=Cyclospora cayetanensis TaxID=88456 RepID=A0A6P6RY15_9EIME|nr:methyltransferase OMS1, mitochondrial-like [Cyclospora cayetanensis]